ncbi:diguanylate cyclase (GGDEF) domain-containing protein [Pseudomonas sp. GM16]|uniref:GGDEF domain-containing protein n=1 Tax=Pseudomonas sp. GM16 TaxID=1144322 RepID=UPI0002726833|nr:diguanylate cyclase (GGDEF) domain-containing protein [Pseudomonas sp. GM16]
MSDDAQRWKEKYLKSIEQQDKLERRWAARLDLLRRGLVRSTLAAEGTDKVVDQCMKEMRDVVRTDDMDAGLAALLPRLEKAVLDSEQRRETRIDQVSTALTSLVTQLQALPLPREVAQPLKKFAKQLDSRVGSAREMPLLLSELSGLQGKALSQLDTPPEPGRPGLLQRLFGSRDSEEAPATESPAPLQPLAAPSPAPETAQPAPVASIEPVMATAAIEAIAPVETTMPDAQNQPESAEVVTFVPPSVGSEGSSDPSEPQAERFEPEPVFTQAAAQTPTTPAAINPDELIHPGDPSPLILDSLPLPEPIAQALAAIDPEQSEHDILFALPDTPEPSYSSVAKHIEDTLIGLLDDLTLPERHRPQAEAMRERLKHGLNWYELIPILDDLATLMLAITDSGQHEFEAYLQQLNERLEAFQSNLQAASEGHADNSSAARAMDTQIREQVDGLQTSVQEAADLDDLKQVLENHLEGLIGTMDQHQKQRDAREQEVAARLKGLSERVAHMEQEAQGFREHLEEQRQKALIDPLTGLPNRAAWSERLEHEIKQWQQHGNTLSLAMLDLDHFKRINDNYGHLAGDKG